MEMMMLRILVVMGFVDDMTSPLVVADRYCFVMMI